jgi:hypothetical protein
MQKRKSVWIVALGLLAALAAGPVMGDAAHAAGKVKAKINGKGFSSQSRATSAVAVTSPVAFVAITAIKVNIGKRTTQELVISFNADLTTLVTPATIPAFAVVYAEGGIGGIQEAYHGENTVNVTITKFKRNKLIGSFEGTLEPAAGGAPVPLENGKIKVKVLVP